MGRGWQKAGRKKKVRVSLARVPGIDKSGWNRACNWKPPPGSEPMNRACRRLECEGRFKEFRREWKRLWNMNLGGIIIYNRREAFYAALAKFPPKRFI